MLHIHFFHRIGKPKPPKIRAGMLGWGALASTILTGSTYNAFAKDLSGALSPLTLLFLSQVLIALFVLLSFGTIPSIKRVLDLPRRTLVPLFLVGLSNGVVAPLLWFKGLEATTAVNAALFGRLEMVFLLVFAWTILGEKMSRGVAAPLLLIFMGTGIIIFQGFSFTNFSLNEGDVYIILASVVFAVGGLMFRLWLHDEPPELVILWRALTGLGFFFVASPFLQAPIGLEIAQFPLRLFPVLLGFCFLSQFLNAFSFYEAIDRLPVSTVSLVTAFEMIGSAVFAHLYLQEPIQWFHYLGGACIMLGIIILELGNQPERVEDREMEQRLVQAA